MIVPDHWAEARRQYRKSGRQVTVRRYGWSIVSEADALKMAESRAEEAIRRILAGEKLGRREPRVTYNGAEGVPIREEVLSRHGEQVITRNRYGAHCLNSPNALFADLDFGLQVSFGLMLLASGILTVAFLAVARLLFDSDAIAAPLIFALMLAPLITLLLAGAVEKARGGADTIARGRLARFIQQNPAWNLRLYRTPAGFRVLATHQPFEAVSEGVQRFFTELSTDPVYVRMCTNQHCFRARLTAKPWRIGLDERPRPGVWPLSPERAAVWNEWVAKYEALAADYAACRYVESMGSGVIHEELRPVIELHDRESRALVDSARLA